MASVSELSAASTEMAGDLAAGLSVLSLNQQVNFKTYARTVLPLDGYLFWVDTGLPAVAIAGALHYSTQRRPEEDANQSSNAVTFTTLTPVVLLNDLADDTILVAELDGLKIAFSARGPYFQASGLNHYVGASILPTMQTQILTAAPDPTQVIVSNSLPIWLSLNSYFPVYLVGATPPYTAPTMPSGLTLYPSFAVPENLLPPYGVIHVSPDGTEPLGGFAIVGSGVSSQLAKDRVRVTLYGCTNAIAIAFLNFFRSFSHETDLIGMMNIPVIRDDKKVQPELTLLAQKKIIDFDVSYLQSTAQSVAWQMIENAFVGAQILPFTPPYA